MWEEVESRHSGDNGALNFLFLEPIIHLISLAYPWQTVSDVTVVLVRHQ